MKRKNEGKWLLSFEETRNVHRYEEISRIERRYTIDLHEQCKYCGCERRSVLIKNKILYSTYSRSGITFDYSPDCWRAKNPV